MRPRKYKPTKRATATNWCTHTHTHTYWGSAERRWSVVEAGPTTATRHSQDGRLAISQATARREADKQTNKHSAHSHIHAYKIIRICVCVCMCTTVPGRRSHRSAATEQPKKLTLVCHTKWEAQQLRNPVCFQLRLAAQSLSARTSQLTKLANLPLSKIGLNLQKLSVHVASCVERFLGVSSHAVWVGSFNWICVPHQPLVALLVQRFFFLFVFLHSAANWCWRFVRQFKFTEARHILCKFLSNSDRI